MATLLAIPTSRLKRIRAAFAVIVLCTVALYLAHPSQKVPSKSKGSWTNDYEGSSIDHMRALEKHNNLPVASEIPDSAVKVTSRRLAAQPVDPTFTKAKVGQEETAYYYYYYYDQHGKPYVVKGRKADKFTRQSTGSFANCTAQMPTSTKPGESKPIDTTHRDADMLVVSCRDIHYRAPLAEIERTSAKIVVGVLSGAGGKGPIHRDSIRSTWASERDGIYFLVAGPWDEIADEYEKYRDLIWIDEEEVYEGEKSVLPFKTESFMAIIHKHALPGSFEYVFKTDDDSYLDIFRLEELLLGRGKHDLEKWHYWGCCTTKQYAPLRDEKLKWSISRELYPEDMYPLYCQGAGFAVSKEFLTCAMVGDHIKNFRYNPFEDVSIGLLAERCEVMPVSDPDLIRQYRADEGLTKMLADDEVKQIKLLPKPVMTDKIVQHRVKTHFDMYFHHVCAVSGC